jgi:hypothetical protein
MEAQTCCDANRDRNACSRGHSLSSK